MGDTEEDAVPTDISISEAKNPAEEVLYTRISDQEISDYPMTLDTKPVKPEDLVHFVFVVSMDDYDRYHEILDWFKEIEFTIEKKGQIVKYETHDSYIFKSKYNEKVHDICEKAIFILPLLSENFSKDKFSAFVTEEAIGVTRLDDACYEGKLGSIIKVQKNDAVRPIYLNRAISTRAGFSLAKGIQYYAKERNKNYVQNQIKDLIKEAIERVEKRRNATDFALTGTSDREIDQLSKKVENVFINNSALSPTSAESDALIETDDGSSILKDQDLSERDFNGRKDSGKEMIADDLCCKEHASTDVARAASNNTAPKEIKGKQSEENSQGEGSLSGSGKGETTINYYISCETAQIGEGSTYHKVEKEDDAILKNTVRCGFNPNETNSTTKTKTMENEANSSISATHPFSKGTHKQKDAIQSVGKEHVSKSVGLIRIEDRLSGTGFRVGNKYVATCYHIIKDIITVSPHFIDSDQLSMEFGRYRNTGTRIGDQNQVFGFERTIAYTNEEYDFVVLELKGPALPPPLTCFGGLFDSEIHLLGHPGGKQMKEDSEVFPVWSPKHDDVIIPQIRKLGLWSLTHLPKVNSKSVDHYGELLNLPRKILFHTTFDEGSSGSPGFIIKNSQAWVILMLSGGAPGCFYKENFNQRRWPLKDNQKVEYGYAMEDIYNQMRISKKELASDIFKEWFPNNDN